MDEKSISLIAMESALMHLQQANKRLAVITIVTLVIMSMMLGAAIYFFTQFEVSTEDVVVDSSGNGNANYIGNDGDITNGIGMSEENDNQKEEQ